MKHNMRINDREWSKHMWERIKAMIAGEGYISAETDPTVPAWAKQPNKPSYTASEVGALPNTTTIPTKTSDLTNDSGFITAASVPTKTSQLTNDSGFVTEDDITAQSLYFKTLENQEAAAAIVKNVHINSAKMFVADATVMNFLTNDATSNLPASQFTGVIARYSQPAANLYYLMATDYSSGCIISAHIALRRDYDTNLWEVYAVDAYHFTGTQLSPT